MPYTLFMNNSKQVTQQPAPRYNVAAEVVFSDGTEVTLQNLVTFADSVSDAGINEFRTSRVANEAYAQTFNNYSGYHPDYTQSFRVIKAWVYVDSN